jgi:A/G-specific adenine glycosylase
MRRLEKREIADFQEVVWGYYQEHGRAMPWRTDPSPYNVLVSEMMLQQTQVSRVIPKFEAFLYTCADFAQLSERSLSDVLALWSGLGYNRRAKFLWQTARIVMQDFGGQLPMTLTELVSLPGIGKNTAGAILAYAFNEPVVFIETNIRTVLFHHFYNDSDDRVSDTELVGLVEQTLDSEHPREWYWALMDYGSHLKATRGAQVQRSKHYTKQSPLKGSVREMRGNIVRVLVTGDVPLAELREQVKADERFDMALHALHREGLVSMTGDVIGLTGKNEPKRG